jgi:hypothetical protein
MGPRPSGSGTSRKRPRPRASVNSGWPQSTQWRGGRLEGGKGTGPSLPPLPGGRDFSAAQLLLALAVAAAGVLDALLEALDPEDALSLEDELLDAGVLVLVDEAALLLDEDEDEPPSFLVEP